MTGDQGRTSLVGGTRVSKCDPRIEAYGTVDELNSQIGMLAVGSKEPYPEIYDLLLMIQNKLFNIGAYLATENAKQALGIEDEDVEAIERIIDICMRRCHDSPILCCPAAQSIVPKPTFAAQWLAVPSVA